MCRNKLVGKKFRSLQTFRRDDNIFNINEHYTLSSIDENESMNIYFLSDDNNNNYMFAEFSFGEKFEDFFISIDDERRININRILYED